MTSPVSTGYPDYGRFSGRAAKLYGQGSTTDTTQSIDIMTVYVGDVEYVGAALMMTTSAARWEFIFYLEEGQVTQLGEYDVDITAGGRYDGSFPVLGPWMRVRRSLPAVTANTSTWTVYQASGIVHSGHVQPETNLLFSVEADPIAATTTETRTTTRTWPGEAMLYVAMDAVSWNLKLYSVQFSGTLNLLVTISNAWPFAVHRLILPPAPIQAQIRNNDGSAHAYDLVLVARPFFPGM